MKKLILIFAALCLLPLSLRAHHSVLEFDQQDVFEFEGEIMRAV